MAERLDLTTPISTPSRTHYRVGRITFDRDDGRIDVLVVGSDGKRVVIEWHDIPSVGGMPPDPIATNLMKTLNTRDFTTVSMEKRILQRAVTDGKLPAGIVSGTPDS